MTPVPILYVISKMGIGGAERHLVDLLPRLDPNRYAPALYCLRVRDHDVYAELARRAGIEVVNGGTGETFRGAGFVGAVRRLACELRRRRTRIVHAYLFHANLIGPLAARLAGVPVALVSKRNLDRHPHRRDRLICRVSNALADRVTTNSEVLRRHVHRYERCPFSKLVVIPNGIDLQRVRAWPEQDYWSAIGGRPKGPVICTIARLVHYKGHADLLEAARMVLDRVPEARFVLVGDGPLRTQLEAMARSRDISRRVRFVGEVTDAAGILPWVDLFVLPSHIEGMSNSLIEAMAVGLPVVATEVGGNAEVVANGETGLIVPPRAPLALAEGILTLLKDVERGRAMGEAGRRRAYAEFGRDRMVERFQALYQERLEASA